MNEIATNRSGPRALVAFANSRFGVLIIGALIGAIGLATWQRQDWLYKQEYLRKQAFIDRQLDLIEKINTDVGKLLSRSDQVCAGYLKGARSPQMGDVKKSFNESSAEWFGVCDAHNNSLQFYFSADVADGFGAVVEATKNLDRTIGGESLDPKEGYAVGNTVRAKLQLWNSRAREHAFKDDT